MADDTNETPAAENKPAPRRRPPRKSAAKDEAASKPAAKRASRPATAAPKKNASKSAPKRPSPSKPEPVTERARETVQKATKAVGGKRNLIAGGLAAAAAGAAAAAFLSLRGSTPKSRSESGARAHQPDGTDSSAQMDAMIADESMIPESTPKA